jgi:hypothetical protein
MSGISTAQDHIEIIETVLKLYASLGRSATVQDRRPD